MTATRTCAGCGTHLGRGVLGSMCFICEAAPSQQLGRLASRLASAQQEIEVLTEALCNAQRRNDESVVEWEQAELEKARTEARLAAADALLKEALVYVLECYALGQNEQDARVLHAKISTHLGWKP